MMFAGGGQDACRRVDLNPDTSNPFLSEEDLKMATEPPLCRGVEDPEEDDVTIEHCLPLWWKWLAQYCVPASDLSRLPGIHSDCRGER